jgi:hypothetical protein
VSGVVQPAVAQPGLSEQPFPLVVVGIRVERPAGRIGEDPPLVVPELASQFSPASRSLA